MSKQILLVTAVSAFLLGPVQGEDRSPSGGPDSGELFAQLDSNKDGQLSAEEIPEDKKRLFQRLVRIADKNNDGKLTREEFVAGLDRREQPGSAEGKPNEEAGQPGPQKMFKRLDANHDGKVTLDEVPEPRHTMFKAMIARGDKDGDGALDKDEFVQTARAFGNGIPGKPEAGKPPEGKRDPKELFRRLDKNGDGKITLDEVPEERRPMVERLLRRADKDGDKAITAAEFAASFSGGLPPQQSPREVELRARAVPRGGLFQALDTDHDGKLNAAEIAAAAEVLKKLDTNGDGTITIEELIATGPGKEPKE